MVKRRLHRVLGALALVLGCAGCATVPFEEPRYVSVENLDPSSVLREFEKSIPENFQLENTVVFSFRGREMATLGVAVADLKKDTFGVVCMTHTGVKLLEVTGQGRDIRSAFAMSEIAERGDYARAVGEDIRKCYFGLVPPAGASCRKEAKRIVFTSSGPDGHVEHVFAGAAPVLVEKRYFEDSRLYCRVGYYEYRTQNGRIYPGGILLRNQKYDYTLTVRLKKIMPP